MDENTQPLVLDHIKRLSMVTMTVFITEPMRLEAKCYHMPDYTGQQGFAIETDGRWELTPRGLSVA